MEVKIDTNPLRLLNKSFVFLHPCRSERFQLQGVYNCTAPGFTMPIAKVRCVWQMEVHLYEVKHSWQLLAEGHIHFMHEMQKAGYNQLSKIQVVGFLVMNRSSTCFQQIVEKELPGIGIKMVHQTELFTQP